MSGTPVTTVLLPGLDGTCLLFRRFLEVADGRLDLRTVAYPPSEPLGYADLEARVRAVLPSDRPFVLVGESFSGPLAIRIAARPPAGLAGLVLATTFHRRPAARPIALLRPLAPAFFRLPLPRHVVRLLLAGPEASRELVQEVRAAVAQVSGAVMAARAHEALDVDVTDELLACRVPLLVVNGRWDRLVRRAVSREIERLRPDAEVHVLDAPHLVLQLRPRESMGLVADFAVRCAVAARPRTLRPVAGLGLGAPLPR